MVKESVNECNKLIAEFHCHPYFCIEELKYHSSWDWLMPVVEKIYSLYDNGDMLNTVVYQIDNDEYGITSLTIFANINMTYDAVVNFIKLYNEKED